MTGYGYSPPLSEPVEALVQQGRVDEAVKLYELPLTCYEELALDNPEFYPQVLWVLSNCRAFLTRMGRPDEADQVLTRCETLRQRIASQYPDALQAWRYSQVSGPFVGFKVRISTPGEYELYVRHDGHDISSGGVYVWVEELADGPGGSIADYYAAGVYSDWNFATRPWNGRGDKESAYLQGSVKVPTVWSVPEPGDFTLRITSDLDGTALDALVFQLSNLPAPQDDGPEESTTASDGVFLEEEGRITMEAEHFTSRISHGDGEWLVVPDEDPGDVAHANFRGTGYLQLLPDSSPTEEQVMAARLQWVKEDPEYPRAWESLGNWQKWYGHLEEAVAAFSQAIKLNPKYFDAWYFRGGAYRLMEDYEKAGEDMYRAGQLEFEPDVFVVNPLIKSPALAWSIAAKYQCIAGDLNGYRRTCAAMLEHYGDTKDPVTAYRVAWSCSRYPGAAVDMDRVVELARTALVSDETNWDYRTALGAALYRAGRYSETVEVLEDPHLEMSYANSDVAKDCFLAMACYRLGRVTDAEAYLTKATQNSSGDSYDTLRLNEADALLNGTEVASRGN